MATRILAALILSLIAGAAIACSGTPASPAAVTPAPIAEPPAPTSAKVTGTVTYRERIALSPDAVVEVKLLDVSRADAPAVTIAEQVIEGPGQVPIAFEIEYDPSELDESFSYAVQARITEGGKLVFINDTRYSVITRGSPTHVDMALVKVPAAPADPATPQKPKMVATPAPVESVTLEVSVSNPAVYTLHIVSGLPSGCVEFDGYAMSRDGNTLSVTVTNLTPAEPVACITIYGQHEGEVDLGTGFTPGETYTVVVNGEVTNAFTARDPEGPDVVVAASPIERVEVAVSESGRVEYTLEVVSRLPKGSSCSWFNGYDVVRPFAGVVDVTVTHLEVTGLMPCTADLPVVATGIPLGSEFTPGETYTVNVNGEVTNAFTVRDPDGPEVVVKASPIDLVEVAVGPGGYSLNVVSRLSMGSSCSWSNGYDIVRPFAGVVDVTVTHLEVTGLMECTADLPVVETEVPLGSDFVAGDTYTVNVNGEVTETFVAE